MTRRTRQKTRARVSKTRRRRKTRRQRHHKPMKGGMQAWEGNAGLAGAEADLAEADMNVASFMGVGVEGGNLEAVLAQEANDDMVLGDTALTPQSSRDSLESFESEEFDEMPGINPVNPVAAPAGAGGGGGVVPRRRGKGGRFPRDSSIWTLQVDVGGRGKGLVNTNYGPRELDTSNKTNKEVSDELGVSVEGFRKTLDEKRGQTTTTTTDGLITLRISKTVQGLFLEEDDSESVIEVRAKATALVRPSLPSPAIATAAVRDAVEPLQARAGQQEMERRVMGDELPIALEFMDEEESLMGPPMAAPAAVGLSPEWIELQDPSTGQTYYYNHQTAEGTWERPV
jgi:hypothetical protein